MFVPIATLCSGTILFSLVGVVILSVTRMPGLSFLTFCAFVPSAMIGTLLFMIVFGKIWGTASGQLTNPVATYAFVVGSLITGVIAGWLIAVAAFYITKRKG